MSPFLPFCVPRSRDVDVYWCDDRVEKYRPVSLDDVVSHKDITGTSMFWQCLLAELLHAIS